MPRCLYVIFALNIYWGYFHFLCADPLAETVQPQTPQYVYDGQKKDIIKDSSSVQDHHGSFSNLTDLYKIQNIDVDVTASSSQQARQKAFIDGQRQAFNKLLERVVTPLEAAQFSNLSQDDLDYMAQDIEINHEKITAVRYRGNLTISFNPHAVEKILKNKGTTIQTHYHAVAKTLIIPLLVNNDQTWLWEEKNTWFEFWQQTQSHAQNAHIVVPIGDLMDIRELSLQSALTGHDVDIIKIMKRYLVDHVLIARLVIKDDKAKLILHDFSAKAALKTQTVDLTDLKSNVFNKAKDAVHCFLENNEKNIEIPQIAKKMSITVAFSNLNEWLNIQKIIETLPLGRLFRLHTLKTTQAEISIHYSGDLTALREHFINQGLVLSQENSHTFSLCKNTFDKHPGILKSVEPNDSQPSHQFQEESF